MDGKFLFQNKHPSKDNMEGSYNSLINMLHISHVSHSFCQCATANTAIKRHTAPSPGETEQLLCVKCPKQNQTSTKKKKVQSSFSLYFSTILLTANSPHFLCPRQHFGQRLHCYSKPTHSLAASLHSLHHLNDQENQSSQDRKLVSPWRWAVLNPSVTVSSSMAQFNCSE